MSTALKVKPNLRPEDFQAQLYAGLVDVRHWHLLPRVEITWGQPVIVLPASEAGTFVGIAIFDRVEDGDELASGYFDSGPCAILKGDTITATVGWPG